MYASKPYENCQPNPHLSSYFSKDLPICYTEAVMETSPSTTKYSWKPNAQAYKTPAFKIKERANQKVPRINFPRQKSAFIQRENAKISEKNSVMSIHTNIKFANPPEVTASIYLNPIGSRSFKNHKKRKDLRLSRFSQRPDRPETPEVKIKQKFHEQEKSLTGTIDIPFAKHQPAVVSACQKSKDEDQTVEMMYNQWVKGNKNDLANSQEFDKIATKYRINEIDRHITSIRKRMQSAVKSRNPWEIRSKKTESDIQIFTRNRESLSKCIPFRIKYSKHFCETCQEISTTFRRNDTETQKAKKKNLRLRLFKERNWSAVRNLNLNF
ncbi:unnamed protein product [Moneuplotes crassus]|uniref:Uncharacterized protein n=1 Tax=Euplotes crassus TaxID=5936 RepID=A0AAD1XFJ5_EUPCR|nr:unnamed protein product [Moneuplotes crassus]